MSDMYCRYSGVKYKTKKRDGEYIITSRIRKEGFSNYIDVLGNEHFDLYMKNVDVNEVDIIYKEDIFIKYKDEYYQLFANRIFKQDVLDDSYMIWTSSEQLADEYVFQKKEQFVFTKVIAREEIEAIKIVRKPILDFKDKESVDEILEGDAIDKWLTEFL